MGGTENPPLTTGVINSTTAGTASTQANGQSQQIQLALKVIF